MILRRWRSFTACLLSEIALNLHHECTEKLELVRLLLNTESESVLKNAAQSETAYLLSTEANKKHLLQVIDNLDKGKGTAIKTGDLWK
jgi:hypothetical protein